ncbi:MAG: Trx7/PDZ domain-containing (seleno)protein, partial [Isosphaeraceae bacterium]
RSQFDYDLTWMAFFMDAEDHFYARYGGRNDEHAESHLSQASLVRAMRAALELHREGKVQSSRYEPTGQPPRTPEEIPPMKAMIARRKSSCIHCHDVKVATLRDLQDRGRFDRSMIFAYPTPRAIGIEVDGEAQDVVRQVLPNSPAARAGLKPGDEIESADGARVLTVGDFARVLELTPSEAVLPLVVHRGGEPVKVDLRLSGDWKRSGDPSWRESTHVAGPNAGFWGMALNDQQKREAGIPVDRMALKVTFLFPNHPTPRKAGLEVGDRIIEVDGRREPMNIRQFHTLCQMERRYGDRVPIVVLREGRETRLTLELPTEPSRND